MMTNNVHPDEVDVVVISHFHPDHVNGLVPERGAVFSNAAILVPEVEWKCAGTDVATF
jgi:metal-dependent hydrolase (beta-lactamase superfamily II)